MKFGRIQIFSRNAKGFFLYFLQSYRFFFPKILIFLVIYTDFVLDQSGRSDDVLKLYKEKFKSDNSSIFFFALVSNNMIYLLCFLEVLSPWLRFSKLSKCFWPHLRTRCQCMIFESLNVWLWAVQRTPNRKCKTRWNRPVIKVEPVVVRSLIFLKCAKLWHSWEKQQILYECSSGHRKEI